MNILISGWYGFGNVGDEAILQAMIEHYRRTEMNSKIRALSYRPKNTREWQNIQAANQPPSGLKSWIACLALFRWVRTFYYFIWCDKFVMGGGGFLSDWDRKVPAIWLRQLKWAKILGKHTALIGVGIGPIFDSKNQDLIRRYIEDYVDEISVRDQESRRWLVDKCKVGGERVSVEIDPVALLDCSEWRSTDGEVKNVGVIYAQYFDRKKLFGSDNSSKDDLENCYVAQLEELKNLGCTVQLISWLDSLSARSGVPVVYPRDFKHAIHSMSLCKAIISFRLHGNILAHALGIPFLPIIYHHKGFGFLDMCGRSRSSAIVVGDGINIEKTEQLESHWVSKTREFIGEIK
ncbi:polysaccharide pyruvyl transferase family protein [Cupriavidus basilensis]|uniref:polysaccharide pyruvyl transferase family protein n=1 Tax=Cupriavidus basilensis TaxID=68895 RepID=UPI0009DA9E78|nr:polysaccharide pyruvyl transferase family protein [Cupriavidus basilensis]